MIKNNISLSTTFEKVIQSKKTASKKLIRDALKYFRYLQNKGMAIDVSEFNFRLALDETIQNAINHGNCSDPQKTVSVVIRGYKKKVDVIVKDEGSGFSPEELLDLSLINKSYAPHGRGIYILKRIANVRWNKIGNCVMLKLLN